MNYLRNCWYVAGYPEEATSKPLARTLLDEPIVIFRTETGSLAALDNRCPHRFAPLDRGTVVGETIRCPYHGLRFDPEGRCTLVPSGDDAPPRAKVRAYPVVERHALMWIWMGDAVLADPDAIPDFAYLEDHDYGWFNGYIHAKGNYQLVIDNLLDLSHAEFLHPMLSSDGWAARNRQSIRQDGDSIAVHNVAEQDNVLPIMQMVNPELQAGGTTTYHERWTAPSLIKLSIQYENQADRIFIPTGHFATPETAGTTHYFTRSGHGWEPHNPQVTAAYGAGIQNVFEHEDIPIIEAQQAFLGDTDLMACEPAVLRSDGAAIRSRRLLAQKIRLEAVGAARVPESADAA